MFFTSTLEMQCTPSTNNPPQKRYIYMADTQTYHDNHNAENLFHFSVSTFLTHLATINAAFLFRWSNRINEEGF